MVPRDRVRGRHGYPGIPGGPEKMMMEGHMAVPGGPEGVPGEVRRADGVSGRGHMEDHRQGEEDRRVAVSRMEEGLVGEGRTEVVRRMEDGERRSRMGGGIRTGGIRTGDLIHTEDEERSRKGETVRSPDRRGILRKNHQEGDLRRGVGKTWLKVDEEDTERNGMRNQKEVSTSSYMNTPYIIICSTLDPSAACPTRSTPPVSRQK